MKSIQELLSLASEYLSARKIDRPKRTVEDLLAYILDVQRLDLYLQYERPVEEEIVALFREKLKRLAKGEPFEYVVGEIDFFGCRLHVDPRVLIPRPETEILAEWVSKKIKGQSLWDLCTGSGALGISLKKIHPHISVSLSDFSAAALAVAEENMKKNGVVADLFLGDLLTPFLGKKVDAIVCNPPYVSCKEYLELFSGVQTFEPQSALVSGEKGTEFYERLAREAPFYLASGGQLFLEIGASQGKAVKEIFDSTEWRFQELLPDWSGKDRFFFLEKQ